MKETGKVPLQTDRKHSDVERWGQEGRCASPQCELRAAADWHRIGRDALDGGGVGDGVEDEWKRLVRDERAIEREPKLRRASSERGREGGESLMSDAEATTAAQLPR